ncbi:MAG: hypothetical protein ACK4NR_04825 [Micavibrio sp.]
MTYTGVRRGNSSSEHSYILIPHAVDKLPEYIEPAQALRLVNNTARGHEDHDMALVKVSDRLQGDPVLESQVRGFWMTDKGLLIHGTMDAAFRLSHSYSDMRDPAGHEETAPAAGVMFLEGIRSTFKGSMEHYTGHVRRQISNISSAFDGFAGSATAPAARSGFGEPKLALAA